MGSVVFLPHLGPGLTPEAGYAPSPPRVLCPLWWMLWLWAVLFDAIGPWTHWSKNRKDPTWSGHKLESGPCK